MAKNVDPAFQGIGQKVGIDIWRIENFQPVPLSESDYGKFYSGDSYIVLKTTALKNGSYQYDAHFWLGKDTSQDEAGTAAIKTVELDAALGGRAVQYREVQGHESDKFLSYFKPCIIPLEGGAASGFKKVEVESFEPRLYVCKGRRSVRVKQVPYTRSSLNHDDVFILDTESKIYQFNGATSSIQERAKALEVVQHIKDTYHDGKCEIGIIDDGKPVGEANTDEFWNLFGGFAPIGKRATSEDDSPGDSYAGKLYIVENGQLNPIVESPLTKGMLESNKCYLLDCGAEIFVWMGRITNLEERKAASIIAEEFLSSQKRPKNTLLTKIIQGFETLIFRSNFDSWSSVSGAPTSEDGKGKVAAMLKQQGVNVKGLLKGAPTKEEIPEVFPSNGKLEVWRINGSSKFAIAAADIGKFYSGDCYLILYSYLGNDRKEEYFLSHWIGKRSTEEDQAVAFRLASQIANSYKGRPVQGRIFEGKEPAEFLALVGNFFLLKGGLSSGYQKKVTGTGLLDDTYKDDGIALFRVEGTGRHNTKAVQVDLDAENLNSSYCYILKTNAAIFVWNGTSSITEEQQIAVKMAEFLKPGTTAKLLKEDSEPAAFWNPLGGKKAHPNYRDSKEAGKDPRLFACPLVKGKLEVTEIHTFDQDDLLSEDVMILDTYTEIFAWVGQNADAKEKQQAFDIAQKYLDRAATLEGAPTDVPVYKVPEGNEPFFFTKYFNTWDPVKAAVQGNSFQKRFSILSGIPSAGGENTTIEGSESGSTPKRRSPASQWSAAVVALSASINISGIIDGPIKVRNPPTENLESPPKNEEQNPKDSTSSEAVEDNTVEENNVGAVNEEVNGNNGEFFSYERLKCKSNDPAPGIDPRKRESYLSPDDFKKVFGMDSEKFYQLPKWKQDTQKKALDLF